MSKIDITTKATVLANGMLQTAAELNPTLQVVKDNVGNSSTLLLGTTDTQINSLLRINTDNAEILDIQDTSANNRFNINRVVQKINLDFASKPADITTQVGAIRTAIDGINLADAVKFQENGQVTFTERVKIEDDSTVTTQTSSVIQSSTTNANLVIAPNGTGALVANIPDGTSVGGNARGANAVDLQMIRDSNTKVAAAPYSVITGGFWNGIDANSGYAVISAGNRNRIENAGYAVIVGGASNYINGGFGFNHVIVGGTANTVSGGGNTFIGGGSTNNVNGGNSVITGGESNTASSSYSTVSGGQSNTASTGTHATVVGGKGNTASGQYSVVGGFTNTASAESSVAIGRQNISSGKYSNASGLGCISYLQGMQSFSTAGGFSGNGEAQISNLVPLRTAALASNATTVLSLDNTGVTGLLIPLGNYRAWNVTIKTIVVVAAITGTATGVTIGDVYSENKYLLFKRLTGTSSIVGTVDTNNIKSDASMNTAAVTITAGASQEMALTFTGPTFVGGGSVTMRVVARIELTEVAF